MSNQVFDFREFDRNNIVLKKPIFISNNYYTIPLKYRIREIDHEIILQTPDLPVLNGITEYISTNGNKKFSIDLSLKEQVINNNIKLFKKVITSIEKFIKVKSKIWKKKTKKNLKEFFPCLKIAENDNQQDILRLKINSCNNMIDLPIYNYNKQIIDKSNINNNSRIISIVHLKNMWFNDGNYGYMFNILQIKLSSNNPNNDKYLFIDGPNNESDNQNLEGLPPIKDDERFSKYFKMLTFKIPKICIKQKMELEGFDPNIIDLDPMKPYLDKDDILGDRQNIISSNDLISGLNSLKKGKPVEKKKY